MFRAAVTFLVVTYISQNASGDEPDELQNRMKNKILQMSHELKLDAQTKAKAIMHFKPQYSYSDNGPYTLGKTTCRVRQKYARMMFLYMKSYNLYDELIVEMDLHHLFEMTTISWYIDNLVRMVEMWATDVMIKKEKIQAEKEKQKQKAHSDRLRWQVQQDTRKIVRTKDQKVDETKKYMDGFDSEFNK